MTLKRRSLVLVFFLEITTEEIRKLAKIIYVLKEIINMMIMK